MDPVPDVSEFDDAIRAYLERMAALRYADASIDLIYAGDHWPPSKEMILAEGPIHDYSGRLIGHPDGHLAVTLERADGPAPLRAEFQRAVLPPGSTFLFHLVINDERVTLKIQGVALGPYHPEQEPLIILGTGA